MKFHGDQPVRVHVRAERSETMSRFAISDNGIGIDPGQAERVFEVFKRLHGRGRYPGTGIGLAQEGVEIEECLTQSAIYWLVLDFAVRCTRSPVRGPRRCVTLSPRDEVDHRIESGG